MFQMLFDRSGYLKAANKRAMVNMRGMMNACVARCHRHLQSLFIPQSIWGHVVITLSRATCLLGNVVMRLLMICMKKQCRLFLKKTSHATGALAMHDGSRVAMHDHDRDAFCHA